MQVYAVLVLFYFNVPTSYTYKYYNSQGKTMGVLSGDKDSYLPFWKNVIYKYITYICFMEEVINHFGKNRRKSKLIIFIYRIK